MAEDRIPLDPYPSRSSYNGGRTHEENRSDERTILAASGEDATDKVTAGLNSWESMLLMAGVCSSTLLLTSDALVVSAGIGGLLVLCVILPAIVYTAILEGRCWNMVRHRWQHERHPYGAIGYEAFGAVGRTVINIWVAVASFFGGVGSLVVCAEMLFLLDKEAFAGWFCYLPIIFVVFLLPFMLLGTPKDMWQIGALSILSSAMALILLLTASVFAEYEEREPSSANVTGDTTAPSVVPHLSYSFRLIQICGITFFALDGHICYPTIYQDMLEPQKSTQVTLGAYGYLISSMFLMIVASYIFMPHDILMGISPDANIINLFPRSALTSVPILLLFIHQCTVTVTANNPLFQSIEERLDIPQEFGWRRALSRSTIVLLELFVGETIPHFGILSTLIGGVCSPMLMFIAPCLCYLRLRSIQSSDDFSKSKKTWMLETAVCMVISVLTPILMVLIVYTTCFSLFRGTTAFTVPCYVNSTLAHK